MPRDPDSFNPARKVTILKKFVSGCSEYLEGKINGHNRRALHIDDSNRDFSDFLIELDRDQSDADLLGDDGQHYSSQINLAGDENKSIDASRSYSPELRFSTSVRLERRVNSVK